MQRILVAVLSAALSALVCAQDLPRMKAGLWQSTTVNDMQKAKGAPPQMTSICMDDAVQKQMIQFSQGAMRGMCSRNDLKVTGNTVTGDTVCQMGGSKMVGHSVMTFVSDTAYHTTAQSNFDPPLMGMKASVTTVEGKYMGACPAGMQPGDMKLPNGQIMNIKTMAAAATATAAKK
jgi:hypothetical protein